MVLTGYKVRPTGTTRLDGHTRLSLPLHWIGLERDHQQTREDGDKVLCKMFPVLRQYRIHAHDFGSDSDSPDDDDIGANSQDNNDASSLDPDL